MSKKEENEPKKTSLGKEILSTSIYLLVVLFLTFLFITFVAQKTKVDGPSMMPTLYDKDQLIVDKISYRFTDPKRFDVIVFPYLYEEDTYYIKRVIGLPGETVQIDFDGNIYINGQLLEENYGADVIKNPGIAADPIVLGEEEYFVLGDNRNNSKDSRSEMVGKIKKDDIIGRAIFRIWPFSSFGSISKKED